MFSFRQDLSAGGFVEDRNVVVDYRYAQGQPSRLPLLASDLVRRAAAVIVTAGGDQAALAAKSAGLPCARPRQSFRHPRDP
jgi:putative ABC transport system substrate-binding protein